MDLHLRTPLAHLNGVGPAAPDWFVEALDNSPERTSVAVESARIETLVWGEPGRPGLLLLHGNGAHADWWSFIAPFFAQDYRVAALSWSGMGGSDRRDAYSMRLFIEEILTVAEATGLFAAKEKPIIVGHSFGGFPTMFAAARHGERLRAAVLLDTPLWSPEKRRERRNKSGPPRDPRPTRVYPTLEAGVNRFRFLPDQPCENLYIADFIARTSLQHVEVDGGGEGWTWRFDPFMWRDYDRGDAAAELKAAKCPIAMMWGSLSKLMEPDVVAYMAGLAPKGAPLVAIPEANHHVMVDQPLALVAALRGLLAGWPAR